VFKLKNRPQEVTSPVDETHRKRRFKKPATTVTPFPMARILDPEWRFWLVIVRALSGSPPQYSVEEVISVSTVEAFWEYYQALPGIHEIKNVNRKRFSIALFRGQVKPAWEDTENANGGGYSFQVPSDVVDGVWEDLLLSAIGQTLGEKLTAGNMINGLMVTPKKADPGAEATYDIQIWTRGREEDNPNSPMKAFLTSLESAQGKIGSVGFKSWHG
jgi:hypothetical protein